MRDMAVIIKNGTIVTASDQYRADILIDGEKIKAIGSGFEDQAAEVIDAGGKYIFPGGIDGHVHLGQISSWGTDLPGFETTSAALVGGTTTVIGFSRQQQGMGLLDSVLQHREEKVEGRSAVDFGLHVIVKYPREDVFDELPSLARAGIPTIKLFMASKGTPFHSDDATLFRMLQKSKNVGILTMVHAENGDIIETLQRQFIAEGRTEPKYHAASHPIVAEEEATIRAMLLAKAAEAPLFVVHISCREAMVALREARAKGIAVYGETCPHYLTLSVDYLSRPDFEGAKYVCSPPLREASHHHYLWEALERGWLQVVGSDHCPCNFRGEKERGRGNFLLIPNGLPGMENRLSILYTNGVLKGRLSLMRMVDVWATSPAKFYGLYPRKGSISVGADADLVVFDPDFLGRISVKTSLQGVDYNPYEGIEQRGRPEKVLLRGSMSVDHGTFIGKIGQGKFIEREPYGLAYLNRMR
jgi:dihydropyrimidinase